MFDSKGYVDENEEREKRNVQYDRIKRHWFEDFADTKVHSDKKCSKLKRILKEALTSDRVLSIFTSNFIVHTLFFITQDFDHFLSSVISNLSVNDTITLLFNLNVNTAEDRFLLNQQSFDRIDFSSSIDRFSLLNYRSSSFYRINILYNNVTCIAYSFKEVFHDVCIDIGFEFTLISDSCAQRFYSKVESYLMFDNKRLRCIGIGAESIIFIRCVDISIRFKTFSKIFVTVSTTTHIVFELKCDIILSVFTLKSHDMIISWFSDQFHVQNHIVSVRTSTMQISKLKKKSRSTSIFTCKFSIISLVKRRIKKNIRDVTVYAVKTIELSTNHEINIFIKHRFLSIEKDYFFKSISHVNMIIVEFIIAIQAIVKDHQDVISISNFELRLIKILKDQIFEHLFTLSRNARSIEINFVFADVFVEKINVESNMFFIIQFSNEIANNKIDISNYWNSKYRFKMQKILNRYNKFFNDDLNKFNNDIEMFIFFRNEIDIFDFKQNLYFFIVRNKKVMNEIFDLFVK